MGHGWFWPFNEGDLYAVSGNAISVGEDLIRAKCCNRTERTPPACFIPEYKQKLFHVARPQPKPNFMLEHHFRSRACLVHLHGLWGGAPMRGESQDLQSMNKIQLHGQFRHEVVQRNTPLLSGVVTVSKMNITLRTFLHKEFSRVYRKSNASHR